MSNNPTTYLDISRIQRGTTYTLYCDEVYFNWYHDLFTFNTESYLPDGKLYTSTVKCTGFKDWGWAGSIEHTFVDICDKNNILITDSKYYYDLFRRGGFWAVRYPL